MISPCDKCGTYVPASNDATIIQSILDGGATMATLPEPRHFLPVPGVCEGSPSRAQYIEGQPRDPRYAYKQEYEVRWRSAYAQAQEEYGGK